MQPWGYGPRRKVKVDDAADWPNAVRVLMRYQATQAFPDSIRVEAVVQVPWPEHDKGDAQTDFRHHNEFSIPFLAMALAGTLPRPTVWELLITTARGSCGRRAHAQGRAPEPGPAKPRCDQPRQAVDQEMRGRARLRD